MATMVVAWGTWTGAAVDAPPGRGRLKGNSSGRSRCRCSVKDEVALAATWLAVDSCTHHSLNVVLQRRYRSRPSAASATQPSGLLAALLDECPDELLGVGFQDAVDLVEKVVH